MKERAQLRQAPDVALELDLIKLAALIKERESSLLLLLEERRQRIWERPQWLLRECQYQTKENKLTREIRGVVLRWVLFDSEQSKDQITKFIRQFWLKIKMVMKMSLERMKVLDLLNYALFERYENIIDASNRGYDRALGLHLYRDLEDLIRNRNKQIHQLLHSTFGQTTTMRNRSEYMGSTTAKPISFQSSTWKVPILKKREHQTLEPKSKRRPFSDQSQRKGRMKLGNIFHEKKVRKIEKKLDFLEDCLAPVMDTRIDAPIDKKKTLEGNIQILFNQIMSRNVANQRQIQKFVFKQQGSFLPKFKTKHGTRPVTPMLMRKVRKVQSSKGQRKDRGKEMIENNMFGINLEKIAKRKYNQKKPQKQQQSQHKKKRIALKNI